MTVAAQRKIRIVCTHRSADLGPPWRLGIILEAGHRSPVGTTCRMKRHPDGIGYGYRLECGNTKCPHAPEFSFKTWRKLVAGLDEADVDTLDIAKLPF